MVMFGTPPDVVWDPRPGAAPPSGEADASLVLCQLDPAFAGGPASAGSIEEGIVEGIYVAPAAGASMAELAEADAVPGRGLRGDRYHEGRGFFSRPGRSGQDITLIAAEALDALRAEEGIELALAEARRNVLTRGIDLNALVDGRFRLGEVECLGRRWCEPCAHLQQLTRPGVLRGLVHRGGLRADILTPGTIHRGDPVVGAQPDS